MLFLGRYIKVHHFCGVKYHVTKWFVLGFYTHIGFTFKGPMIHSSWTIWLLEDETSRSLKTLAPIIKCCGLHCRWMETSVQGIAVCRLRFRCTWQWKYLHSITVLCWARTVTTWSRSCNEPPQRLCSLMLVILTFQTWRRATSVLQEQFIMCILPGSSSWYVPTFSVPALNCSLAQLYI